MRLISLAVSAALSLTALVAPSVALADSCWVHNGSVMRLHAQGNARAFTYEAPRTALYGTGIGPGSLLFNGQNYGGWYTGVARVFSASCPGQPLSYTVSGPVGAGQTSVTLVGERPVRQHCQMTGAVVQDALHFTYSHQC